MKVLINENQYQLIILESFTEDILKGIKDSEITTTGLIDNSENNFDLSINNLSTTNTNIGGLLGPVNDYIIEEFENISEDDKKLIITSLICLFFSSDENVIYKSLYKIKEKKIIKEFKKAYNKATELKESFINYLKYLQISSSPNDYFFMVPYIPDLLNTDIDIVFDNKLANRLSLLSGLSFEKSKDLIEKLISSRSSD